MNDNASLPLATLPPEIFELVARFTGVSDLIALAGTSQDMHRSVSALSWTCARVGCDEDHPRIFQGVGAPTECTECGFLCTDCVEECEKCHKRGCFVCEMHYCEHCDKLNCYECTSVGGACNDCGDSYCDDCENGTFLCAECDTWFCYGCGGASMCGTCYRMLCDNCNIGTDNDVRHCTAGKSDCTACFCENCGDFSYCGDVNCFEMSCKECGPVGGGLCSSDCEWEMEDYDDDHSE